MSKEPLHPLEIPEDTTKAGLAGWVLESVSSGLCCAALLAVVVRLS